jgi:hypothetical protein
LLLRVSANGLRDVIRCERGLNNINPQLKLDRIRRRAGLKHLPLRKQFAHRRKAVPFRLRPLLADVEDMQRAPRRDGEPHRMSESGAVAKREIGPVYNGLKRGLVHEHVSRVFKKSYACVWRKLNPDEVVTKSAEDCL